MSDLSKVQIQTENENLEYNFKDAYARQRLITTASAIAQTLAPENAATVTIDVTTPNTISFTFGIPRGYPGIMNASFSGNALLLDVSGS